MYLAPIVFLFVDFDIDFVDYLIVVFFNRFLRYFPNLRLIKDREADKMVRFLE